MTRSSLSTVVLGAGAVGSFYGAMLARAGLAVHLIAREPHVAAIAQQGGLRLDMGGQQQLVPVAATSTLDALREADLVLVCVKSTDTAEVAAQMAPLLRPDALVLSLQNGVENADTLARTLSNPVIPTVVYVAVGMPEPGRVTHHGRGELVIGPRTAAEAAQPTLMARLQGLVTHFAQAQVGVSISLQVMEALWEKLVINCAYNALSALTQQPYGLIAQQDGVLALQRALVAEVVAVARAQGLRLDEAALWAATAQIAHSMATQRSSTAQDLVRGKATEIDHLNGFVARRGAALGVATPMNQALWAMVKLAETSAWRPTPSGVMALSQRA
ncbi:MAG: 2-dehydropantoate 2-reductase [Ideonella sp. MAG2]|nr:MAG: 2-dehydropantoate 2-reductase [Ideonella sp. MAG2]